MKDKAKEQQYVDYIAQLESDNRNVDMQKRDAQSNQMALSSYMNQQNQNIAEFQLNLDKELDRIYHLLSGHMLVRDENGERWDEPDDDRLKVFSEYGIKALMNIISFYVHKGILLSYYSKEEYIQDIVWNFATELSDLIYNRYEYFFHYPSPEELFDIYLPIIKRDNLPIDENELYWKCVQWSNEELQSKFRHYTMIIYAIADTVEATFRRALGGKERESLRKNITINQSLNSPGFDDTQTHKSKWNRSSTW